MLRAASSATHAEIAALNAPRLAEIELLSAAKLLSSLSTFMSRAADSFMSDLTMLPDKLVTCDVSSVLTDLIFDSRVLFAALTSESV